MRRIVRTLCWTGALLGLLLVISGVWSTLLQRSAERRFPMLGALVHVLPDLQALGADSGSSGTELEGESSRPIAIHCIERGIGQPVVLLHGAFGGVEDWNATIMDTLATRYRVIALDRPGHGYSERVPGRVNDLRVQAEAVRAALHELHVVRPVLVGFSFGGSVALAYALDHQDELGALVTLNVVSHGWPDTTSSIYRIPAIPLLGTLFEHTLVLPLGEAGARSRIANSFAPESIPDSFAASPLDLALTPGRFAANSEDMLVLDGCVCAQSSRYAELTLPTWILVGEGDQVATPSRHSHALHDQIRGSHLVSIEGAGHQLPYRHAQEIIAAIDAAVAAMNTRGR